jgi:hypothetical protein
MAGALLGSVPLRLIQIAHRPLLVVLPDGTEAAGR